MHFLAYCYIIILVLWPNINSFSLTVSKCSVFPAEGREVRTWFAHMFTCFLLLPSCQLQKAKKISCYGFVSLTCWSPRGKRIQVCIFKYSFNIQIQIKSNKPGQLNIQQCKIKHTYKAKQSLLSSMSEPKRDIVFYFVWDKLLLNHFSSSSAWNFTLHYKL